MIVIVFLVVFKNDSNFDLEEGEEEDEGGEMDEDEDSVCIFYIFRFGF